MATPEESDPWLSAVDPDGKTYYFHRETMEVSWTKPEWKPASSGGVKAMAEAEAEAVSIMRDAELIALRLQLKESAEIRRSLEGGDLSLQQKNRINQLQAALFELQNDAASGGPALAALEKEAEELRAKLSTSEERCTALADELVSESESAMEVIRREQATVAELRQALDAALKGGEESLAAEMSDLRAARLKAETEATFYRNAADEERRKSEAALNSLREELFEERAKRKKAEADGRRRKADPALLDALGELQRQIEMAMRSDEEERTRIQREADFLSQQLSLQKQRTQELSAALDKALSGGADSAVRAEMEAMRAMMAQMARTVGLAERAGEALAHGGGSDDSDSAIAAAAGSGGSGGGAGEGKSADGDGAAAGGGGHGVAHRRRAPSALMDAIRTADPTTLLTAADERPERPAKSARMTMWESLSAKVQALRARTAGDDGEADDDWE